MSEELTYDDNVKKWKKAYTELLRVCEKYPGFSIYNFRDIDTMMRSAKGHLMLIEWYEKYGLKINHDHNPYEYNYLNMGDYMTFNHFYDAEEDKASGSGRFISWSDDDRQPNNEWLLVISFPTGAYIFGEDYDGQKELFQNFMERLKSYKPDYSDTVNKTLYWKLENAKPIYEEFSGIKREFMEMNRQELNKRKADKLRRELAKLEGETNE